MTQPTRRVRCRDHLSIQTKVLALLVLSIMPVYSYADPGSGILIYQIFAAACVGALFYVRKLLLFFGIIGRKRG